MRYIKKQIYHNLRQNKGYIAVLVLNVFLASFMHFLIQFTIDKNSKYESYRVAYMDALQANQMLAMTVLFGLGLIAIVVFYMFFKRFMMLHKQEFGCYMALGYTSIQISSVLAKFSLVVSGVGSLIGMVVGYFGSAIVMNLYQSVYSFPYFELGIHFSSIGYGILMLVGAATVITYGTIIPFMKKEPHILLNKVVEC